MGVHLLWYRLDQVPQASALADGDREADIHFPAGGNDSVGVKPLSARTVRPHVLSRRKWAPRAVLARPSRRHQHLAGAGGIWPAPRAPPWWRAPSLP